MSGLEKTSLYEKLLIDWRDSEIDITICLNF